MNFIQFTAPKTFFIKLPETENLDPCFIFMISRSRSYPQGDTASQLEAIEKRLAALEQENAKLKERIIKLEKGGAQEIAKQLPGLIPQDETKESILR